MFSCVCVVVRPLLTYPYLSLSFLYNRFEIPRAVLLESEPFTVENDLMTPTFKIKRHPVVQQYREKLTGLYNEIHQKDSKL